MANDISAIRIQWAGLRSLLEFDSNLSPPYLGTFLLLCWLTLGGSFSDGSCSRGVGGPRHSDDASGGGLGGGSTGESQCDANTASIGGSTRGKGMGVIGRAPAVELPPSLLVHGVHSPPS